MLRRLIISMVMMLTVFPSLYGAEVALVTSLTGSASACIDKESWAVTLAEIFSDGVEIKVGENSSMVIVHMLNNQEYILHAGALASISITEISGDKVEAKALQMVSSDLSLGLDSAHQAGSASVDRSDAILSVNKSSEADDGNAPATLDSSAGNNVSGVAPQVSAPAPAPAPSEPREMPKRKMQNVITKSFSQDNFEEKMESRETASGRILDNIVIPEVKLAIPMEKLAEISKSSVITDIVGGSSFSSSEPVNGWVDINVSIATSTEMLLEIQGELGKFPVKVKADVAEISMVEAWKLEKAGFLWQAASMWIAIRNADELSAGKVAIHLKRLQEKMSK